MVWSAVKPSVCQDFSEKLGRLFFEFQSRLMAAFLTDRKGAKEKGEENVTFKIARGDILKGKKMGL